MLVCHEGSDPEHSFFRVFRTFEDHFACTVNRGVHSIVRRLRTNPPRKINLRFFFLSLFAFSHRGLFLYKWIESEWVWQAFFCNTRTDIAILKLQENCNGCGRVGRGPGRVIDIAIVIAKGCERDAQGIAVRVVEAMWCSVAIRAATIGKKRAVFECLGGRL